MKQSNIFWGILIVGIGVYLLLDSFDLVTFNFSFLTQYWSLALILWGLTFFKLPKAIKNTIYPVLSIFIILLVIGFTQKMWFCGDYHNYEWSDHNWEHSDSDIMPFNHTEPFDGNITSGDLTIDIGAADVKILGCSDSLIKINSMTDVENYFCNIINTQAHVNFSSNDGIKNLSGRKSKIYLNTTPVWDLNINTGAGGLYCDLSNNKIRSIRMESGASKSIIKLGSLVDTVKLNIESGVSKIKVMLPKEYTCITTKDMALSSVTTYDPSSKGVKNKSKVVYLDFEGALSNLNVVYY